MVNSMSLRGDDMGRLVANTTAAAQGNDEGTKPAQPTIARQWPRQAQTQQQQTRDKTTYAGPHAGTNDNGSDKTTRRRHDPGTACGNGGKKAQAKQDATCTGYVAQLPVKV